MTIGAHPTTVDGDGGSAPVAVATEVVPVSTGIESLIERTVALRRELEAHEATCRLILDRVAGDAPVGWVLSEVGADRWRSSVTEAIQAFETSRHAVRIALVAMSVADGMSIAEVARSWGVSRQLASRWVHECGVPVG